VRDKVQVDDSGDEVSASVSLLHESASETTRLNREVFEGRGGGQAPDTSHADPEKTPDDEELSEGLNEAATKGKNRDDEEVDDQWPLSAKSVGDETKDDLWRGGVRGVGRG